MAVIKTPTESDNPINYVATLAFFCCVSCVVLMSKFRKFRASINFSYLRKKDSEIEPAVSMTGAYRINIDEFYGNGRGVPEPPKKLSPSMVVLPPSTRPALPQSSRPDTNLRPTKSTSDLTTRQNNLPDSLTRSTNDVSLDPRGRPPSTREDNPAPTRPNRIGKSKSDKEQKKIEKQRLAEQKAKDKAEVQELARKEKLRKEAEKKAAQEQARAAKAYKKKAPPVPKEQSTKAPPTPHVLLSNPLAMNGAPSYSTNTLESSISKSSGPPPYSEVDGSEDVNAAAGNSNSGNVSFSKPIDNPSWDLISQHRQQMSRPATSAVQKGARKNMVLDLQYKLGDDDKDNTDA